MRQSIASAMASIAISALLYACEQPGHAEQQKETQATEQLNGASAQNANAQAQANREIVNARADFAKAREDYLHQKRIDLITLDEKIFDLETRAQTATGKTRANLTARVPDIRAERNDFANHMRTFSTETGAAWDTAEADLDKEWDRLKNAVDHAAN
jgi:hypothetical protein